VQEVCRIHNVSRHFPEKFFGAGAGPVFTPVVIPMSSPKLRSNKFLKIYAGGSNKV
jgi:hypothetical protein